MTHRILKFLQQESLSLLFVVPKYDPLELAVIFTKYPKTNRSGRIIVLYERSAEVLQWEWYTNSNIAC